MTDKCPNCGYCPACGRSDQPVIPWWPMPYYGPWWGIYPPSTTVPPYQITTTTAAPITT